MYQKSTLSNGLRIVTITMPHTRSVTVSIMVGAGARYEMPAEAGISHFIEHMCFKGTERRPTAKDVSETIEGVGGFMNATTDHEMTAYWCKVPQAYFLLSLDLLVDMLRNSTFDPLEVEKERKVVQEELRSTNDSPQQQVDLLIDEVVWPDQPLGRDVGGTEQSTTAITREMLLGYMAGQYVPNNVVLSVAGNVTHQQVIEAAEKATAGWKSGSPRAWLPSQNGQTEPRMKITSRRTEQTHLCLAVRGIHANHPDRQTLDLLDVVLGGSATSRLFLELREKRGLAYDVHSYASYYRDAGSINVYAGVKPASTFDAIDCILSEVQRLKERVPDAEIQKAKEIIKGRLLLRMEDNRSVAGWAGAQELLTGQIKTVDEVTAAVEAINSDKLQQVATDLIRTDKLNLAVVGPFRSEKRFQRLMKV